MVAPARGCGRRLRRLLDPLVAAAGAVPGADRYRKRFPARAHLWLLLRHALCGGDSLRQTHADVVADEAELARLGLPGGISRSQLARSSTSRPAACFEALLAAVVAVARGRAATDPAWRALAKVQAVDSTFLALSLKLSPWSRHGGHAPGVRLQTGLDLAGAIPSELRLTLTDVHDTTALAARDLAAVAGWTLLIDLGYYAHRLFATLRAAGVSVVCRLHAQAAYRVTAAHPVDPTPTADGDVILGDETITLGSPNNRRGAVLPGMRLVVSRNAAGAEQRFVTDRHDLTAAAVVALYRKRWQIELFFRWLKYQLKALRPFGNSREAVWLTVVVCAIAAVLAMLAEPDRPKGDSRVAWLRGVGAALLHAPAAPAPTPADTS
ncbi:MAG: IS4 family transposase [Candidatus Limnocylindria bacterium]